jgi:hypothetical protein
MPRTDADLYICHNRGCSGVKWFTTEQKRRTCVFGSNEYYGVLNEEDGELYSKKNIEYLTHIDSNGKIII